jgi:DNA modification methylase
VWASSDGIDDEGFVRFRSPHKGDREDESSGIDAGDTLQYMSARENEDERHLCPLQLEVIRRLITLYSNPGEVVWSPFMGIGSEGVTAIEMGRKFIGAELKASYFGQAVRNLRAAETQEHAQGDLFGAA